MDPDRGVVQSEHQEGEEEKGGRNALPCWVKTQRTTKVLITFQVSASQGENIENLTLAR